MTDYVTVTSGVTSSLGKGVVAASLGAIFRARRLTVSMLKLSPHINAGSGRISPREHGEVFVSADGAEGDLDLGHYERFVGVRTGRHSNITSGHVYEQVIAKERRGDYLGATVQVVPHITDEIKRCVRDGACGADICIVEIGGTVGDIELLPFIEAVRQMRSEGDGKVVHVHLTLVPTVAEGQETKTKPTQHSVKELRAIGVQPDILVCRSRASLSLEQRRKISLFTNVAENCVICFPDVPDLHEVPLLLHEQSLDAIVLDRLDIAAPAADLNDWTVLAGFGTRVLDEVQIGLIGEFARSADSHVSLREALAHAGIRNDIRVRVSCVEPDVLEADGARCMENMDGILVAGGAGEGDLAGKMRAVRYARQEGVPYLGICLGMHVAIIEFGRNVLGLLDANSTEFDPLSTHPVMIPTPLRLGAEEIRLAADTLAYHLYACNKVAERHRSRFEFNNRYLERYRQGIVFSGFSPEGLVEVIEIPRHRWFVATQFRPEFTSTPHAGHPLFNGFIQAARSFRSERQLKTATGAVSA